MNTSKVETSPMAGYERQAVREGPVPTSSRFFQALGSLPDTFKNFAFNTFLLFYYNQVLGLPAAAASLAITAALIVDAITDPLVGAYSDRLRHRLGRRHPFMFASALPLAFCLWAVFSPPETLDQGGLTLWLLAFAVGVRASMTLFTVPWNALFAEFSDDYAERSAIVTWRYVVGWTGGVIFTFSTWTFIFPSTEAFTPGHLDPDAYGTFALVLAASVGLAAFLTAWLTRREIPYLRQPARSEPLTLRSFGSDVAGAIANRNYLMIVLAMLTSFAIAGTGQALELYLNTFFWGLAPEQLRWFTLSIIGAVVAFVSVPVLQMRYDKRTVVLTALAFLVIQGMTIISLRLLDVLPENGDPLLLRLLVVNEIVRIWALTVLSIMVVSMVADTLDEQELVTGRRQEGVFSAAIAFAAKAMSGIGIFAGGLILDFVLAFPRAAAPGEVSPEIVRHLGIVAGLVLPVFYALAWWFLSRYRLTRERHAEIQAALQATRAAAEPAP
jgi:Na+/melibiose symporter-like transporter